MRCCQKETYLFFHVDVTQSLKKNELEKFDEIINQDKDHHIINPN